ncbi:MAG: thioredoxin family protein, partial [Flammeovirgaceae bacterium]|nr:thioredoxin family protein [Flammeovirgaceae bacterium]
MGKLLMKLFIVLLSVGFLAFDNVPEGAVQWLTFEQAVEKAKTEKRPIFIDVYTDWCGWCKVMDKNT